MLNDLSLMDLKSFSFLPFFPPLLLMSSFLGTFFLFAVPGSLQSFLPSYKWGIYQCKGLEAQHFEGMHFPSTIISPGC